MCNPTLAVIVASTREGRFGPTIAAWFGGRAARHSFEVDLVDLATTPLPAQLSDDHPSSVRSLGARFTAADAFAIVTPEYNRSYPAPLKAAIDWYDTEFAGKPIALVAYGRESGGSYAVAHLRDVFTELNAVVLRDAICLPAYWDRFAADGTWPKAAPDLDDTVRHTLDQLTWWALALRDARSHTPCPQ